MSSTKTVIQTGRNTTQGGKYRELSQMTHRQLEPRLSYNNRFIYGQKFPDDGNKGQNFVNYVPHSQGAALSGNSQLAPSVIIEKSSQRGAAWPFYQTLHSPPAEDRKDAPKSHSEEKNQGRGSQGINGGKTFWQPAESMPFSTQSSGLSLAAPQARHSSSREKNKLDVVGPWGTHSKTETNKFFSSASQISPLRPLVSNSFQFSEFKSNLSPEKQVLSITDSAQGSLGSYNKKAQLFLSSSSPVFETVKGVTADRVAAVFKKRLPEASIHSRMSSGGEKVQRGVLNPGRFNPGNFHHLKSRFHHANFAKRGVSMDNLTRHSHRSKAETHGTGIPPLKESVASGRVNLTTEETTQKTKGIADFKGFIKRIRKPVNKLLNLSSSHPGERNNFRKSILKKGTLEVTNVYHPSSSPKYSFGLKITTPPNDLTPLPATSDGETNESQPLLSDYDVKIKRNRGRPFQSYSRIYGLKGFGSWPHEGARGFIKHPYKSVRDQAVLRGFKGRGSQIWQPESSRNQRWQNETAPGSDTVREDQKEESNRSLTRQGLQPDHHKSGNASGTEGKQNKTTAPVEHRDSSSSLRPAAELSPNPRSPSQPRTVIGHHMPRPSIGVARGQRVSGKATMKLTNYSLPQNAVIFRKPVSRLQVITYTDILGSASFTGVRVANDTTATPVTEDSSVPTAAEERGEKEEEEKEKEVEVVEAGEREKEEEVEVGEEKKDEEDREEEGKKKQEEVEEVGEQEKKEDGEEEEKEKEKKVEKVEEEGKEEKDDEKEIEEEKNIEEKGVKDVEVGEEEEEDGEQSVDSEVAVHGGNHTSRSPEAKSGGDRGPQDADSDGSTSELDSEGSGGGSLITSDASPDQSLSEESSEVQYLRTSTRNHSFQSANQTNHTET